MAVATPFAAGPTILNADPIDIADIGNTISPQRQNRHIQGTPEWVANGQGGYFNNPADAQAVLDAVKSGNFTLLGHNNQGQPVVRVNGVSGFNNNPCSGFSDQPTNVFFIKGTRSVSVVPTDPTWRP